MQNLNDSGNHVDESPMLMAPNPLKSSTTEIISINLSANPNPVATTLDSPVTTKTSTLTTTCTIRNSVDKPHRRRCNGRRVIEVVVGEDAERREVDKSNDPTVTTGGTMGIGHQEEGIGEEVGEGHVEGE